jgi:chaperonin GroEL (HSP60 family)
MGDATNLVLILAGELLKRSEHLLTMGLHPSDVILGYEMALEKGRQELECEKPDSYIHDHLLTDSSNGRFHSITHSSTYHL